MFYLKKQVRQSFTSGEKDVQTAEVSVGSISTTVSGSGSLVSDGITEVTVPAGVELKKRYVEAGEQVEAGQTLATVTQSSVLSALAEVQAQLEETDAQLASLGGAEADDQIKTALAGRVKAVYAAEDDSVAAVMAEHGALALLSLDGYLAADLETAADADAEDTIFAAVGGRVKLIYAAEGVGVRETVSADGCLLLLSLDGLMAVDLEGTKGLGVGESVTVRRSDGTETEGRVAAAEDADALAPVWIGASRVPGRTAEQTENAAPTEPGEPTEPGQTEAPADRMPDDAAGQAGTGFPDPADSAPRTGSGAPSGFGSGFDASGFGSGFDASGFGSGMSGARQEEAKAYEQYSVAERQILSITPQDSMTVTISVDELDVLSLREALPAEITLEALKGRRFTGTVTEISRTGTNEGGNTKFSVTVSLPRQEDLLTGMNASVKITTAETDAAALIPAEALVEDGSRTCVYTAYDERTDTLSGLTEVETGVSDGMRVEILSGLTPGSTVWYRYADSMN